MILEANLGESVKKLLIKLKEFVKSIPEKIRKLWTKLKTKLLDLLRKLKKKRVDTSSTEEDKTITFDYIPYKEAIDHTSVELDVFGKLENFVDKYIDPDLDKKDYTDQQQLFADATNILRKSVTSKGEYGLEFKAAGDITKMIDRIKEWQDGIEKAKKSLSDDDVFDKYYDFNPDDIKKYIADLDKDLGKTSSYFKKIEKSIDKSVKKDNADLDIDHYKYEAVSGIASIVSGSVKLITSLVSGISTVVGKGLAQHNKLSVFIDKYYTDVLGRKDEGFTSFDEKAFRQAIKDKDYLCLKINTISSILDDPTFERGETRKVLQILKKQVPEIFEEQVELDYEIRLERSAWDKRYFTKLVYWLQKNFAEERVDYIEEVGKAVHGDTSKAFRQSLKDAEDFKAKRQSRNK